MPTLRPFHANDTGVIRRADLTTPFYTASAACGRLIFPATAPRSTPNWPALSDRIAPEDRDSGSRSQGDVHRCMTTNSEFPEILLTLSGNRKCQPVAV
jgi:hypothetical protein